ncbi:hypothetical protein [Rhizobium sp. Root1220]|nr:hypothetical protein [Rhizobium sp. Root1220]
MWSVADIFTGHPVVVDDVPLDFMTTDEVDDMVDLMNGRDLKARGLIAD